MGCQGECCQCRPTEVSCSDCDRAGECHPGLGFTVQGSGFGIVVFWEAPVDPFFSSFAQRIPPLVYSSHPETENFNHRHPGLSFIDYAIQYVTAPECLNTEILDCRAMVLS